MNEDERRQQLVQFLKDHKRLIIWLLLAFIIYTSLSFRFANLGSLKDATTGKYIAADLDAFLWYRYGEYILEHGTHPTFDPMRFVPVGEYWEPLLHPLVGFPYFLAYLYKFIHFFNSTVTYDYIYVIYPSIVLGITLFVFFLLVKTVFSAPAALLATAALGYHPAYLFRTMTGVADHDAVGMLMLTLSLYLYIIALKQEKKWSGLFVGFLTGLSTILMVIVWPGGGNFLYLILGGTTIIQIFLNVFHENEYYAYTAWFVTFASGLDYLGLFDISQLIGSTTTELASAAFGMATVYYFLFEKNLFGQADLLRKNMPSGITSILCIVILGFIVISVVHGPFFLSNKAGKLYTDLISPWGKDRWQLTVAEQHQPYLVDWYGQMGKYYVIFFLLASIFLFYETIKPLANLLKKLQTHYLSIPTIVLFYVAFIFSLTYSRYSQSSLLNGTNTLSVWLYLGSLVMFIGGFLGLYLYLFYQSKENKGTFYETVAQINKIYVLIFVWFFFMVIGARGAIRLLFTFAPITTLLFGYFTTRLFELAYALHNQTYRIPALVILALLVLSPMSLGGSIGKGLLFQYYEGSKAQASYTGSPYNQQWQFGMDWVRRNTPLDAVFAHWWDYGYWIQTGGGRATVTDGGNEHSYWNYQMGRHVLTAANQTEALDVLAAHNASHFLMVSDEIGKYTAFSSIGSDENYDRYSWINEFTINPQQTRETRNSTIFLYQGQYPLDHDFMYNGQLYPKAAAGIGGFFVPFAEVSVKQGNTTVKQTAVLQPAAAIFNSNGQRTDIPLECIYINGQYIKFPQQGLKGCLRIMPSINGKQQNPIGAGLYVSEVGIHALWTNLYLFDKKNPDFPTDSFESVYDDSNNMPLLMYNGRLIGPMRIWKINYPKDFFLDENKRKQYIGFEHENPAATRI